MHSICYFLVCCFRVCSKYLILSFASNEIEKSGSNYPQQKRQHKDKHNFEIQKGKNKNTKTNG